MSEIYIDRTLYTTKPDNGDQRLSKEMSTYKLLEELEIDFIRVDHGAAGTIEDCLEVEKLLGTDICKNLFLCNRQETKFYLLMMPGEKPFKTKELSGQIGSSRLSFAKAEYMEQFLHITPGSVSVMGLMNDKENKVQLLIDQDILRQEYIGCHPCVNTSSMKLKTKDIVEKFLPAVHHSPILVEL
ncbi:prolyl-tRNA synthetase associated domain-containing protein [Anaerolentibacter hominis]|uniref:prolyl-tRNA synthetase associated domain-containing protein n=1 Tax=Anaerolentibacter hominis TaxID=3079009 RepID=UPI0031B80A6A